jgi:murein tripeptide amidase MpaA
VPPPGHLSAAGIEGALAALASDYPTICQLVPLPESSVEGRSINAVRITGTGGSATRPAILLIGGVHAREVINPDLLVTLAYELCRAYDRGRALGFRRRRYPAATVRAVMDALEIFVLPLVNPDGRVHVQSPTGYAMWRKNRRVNAGAGCLGVDINRNYDFLWAWTIGATSAQPCVDTYKGPAAFSEPETRNVRWLLDSYPAIGCLADVHSFSELVLYPWSGDDAQTTDPAMSFQNAAYDGLRGTPGDTAYREFMPAADLGWYAATGTRISDAIADVRRRRYTVKPGIQLYPSSGTSKDFAFSRHLADPTKPRVRAFVIETGREFQPPWSEASKVIQEVSAGLVELCLACAGM